MGRLSSATGVTRPELGASLAGRHSPGSVLGTAGAVVMGRTGLRPGVTIAKPT
jgi:hypothetical protein